MDSALPDSLFDPHPDPTLQPHDVVRLQLDALQNNDLTPDNGGIRIAYRFTSPDKQDDFRTINDFIRVIKGPYAPLIGFECAELGALNNFRAGHATLQAWVYRDGRAICAFLWFLSRQPAENDHAGCWLVDFIARVL